MSNDAVPVAFATALEVGGPTGDGMVHITFTRQSLGAPTGEGKDVSGDDASFKTREISVMSTTVPVVTVLVPFGAFQNFGKIFTDVNESMKATQLERRREAMKRRMEAEKALAAKAAEGEEQPQAAKGADGDQPVSGE